MPAVFSVWYDDAVSGQKGEAERKCEAVRAALAAAGIDSRVEDDPPWTDAGNLSGYYQDCSGGELSVTVAAADAERAKGVAGAGASEPRAGVRGGERGGEDVT